MAKKSDDTDNKTSDISKNFLGSLLKGYEDTHFNYFKTEPKIIASGSLKLDSYVKVKSGTTLRLGGPAEVGKTSQSLLFAKNYMQTMPKSKSIYVNAESKLPDELLKRTGMKFVFTEEDWDYGSVFVFETNVFDTICDVLKAILKNSHEQEEHLCIIVDSVDMLTLNASLNNKSIADGRKPAGVNYLTKELFRHISPLIRAYNAMLIMITQYSGTFTMDRYEQEAPGLMDGNKTHALNHQASYAFYYRPRSQSHYILEHEKEKVDPVKNKILGIIAKVDIKKSASDESGIMIEIPIKRGKIGNAVWTEKEIFDVLVVHQLIEKKGSWLEIRDVLGNMAKEDKIDLKLKHQGLEQFSEYFEANPAITAWLVEKIKLVHS